MSVWLRDKARGLRRKSDKKAGGRFFGHLLFFRGERSLGEGMTGEAGDEDRVRLRVSGLLFAGLPQSSFSPIYLPCFWILQSFYKIELLELYSANK